GDGDQPVAELDPGVEHRVARRVRGDQAAARALRPVRAPQARLAEPDRGTGRDDPGRADHPGEGEVAHRGGGGGPHRPRPAPRERAGARARAAGVRDLLVGHGPMVMGWGGGVRDQRSVGWRGQGPAERYASGTGGSLAPRAAPAQAIMTQPMASHSRTASAWSSRTRPTRAATAGSRLIQMPKTRRGIRRSAPISTGDGVIRESSPMPRPGSQRP